MAVIGMDLDNTMINFDRAFHAGAVARGWLAIDCPVSRIAVRTALRAQPAGEARWTELQGEVYGQRILREATVCDGLPAFWHWAVAARHRLVIISHKSVRPALGPAFPLRDAARTWLAQQSWFHKAPPAQLQFADTIDEKVELIRTARCDLFIDDRLDVLCHPQFPHGRTTQPIWYTADPGHHCGAYRTNAIISFSHWQQIADFAATRWAVAS